VALHDEVIVDGEESSMASLHVAASYGSLENMSMLLEAGADLIGAVHQDSLGWG
jgi:ankyrin repeat protein